MNSLLIFEGHMIEVPKETPCCGVLPELAHTVANIRLNLVYIWLYNKDEFWFFPIGGDSPYLEGYAWNQRFWGKKRININSVKSYY